MKKITYLSFFIILGVLSSCRFTKDRPVLKVPDGNNDRMEKTIFTGTQEDPKYWLSKVTVVGTTFETQPFVFQGMQSQTKAGYFEFTRDKLQFNNIVTRRSVEPKEVAEEKVPERINEWSVKHSEFRLAEVDGYTTNREEENNYIKWNEKSYFTIDWSKADISEANSFPYYISYAQNIKCWNKKTAYVIDSSRVATEDYIGFTVAVEYEQVPLCSWSLKRWLRNNFVTTVHYKYSFKRIPDPRIDNENYTPYVYTDEQDPLLKKYGYYRTVRPAVAEDNRDKNIFYMNRWNPNKKHTFYFTKDYPEKYKDIAHGLICHTNKLFTKNKLSDYPLDGQCEEDGSVLPAEGETCSEGICFELKENSGQEFGDLRYSFFHLIESHNNRGILGYGPLDAHPATGEIVSGNVVLYTDSLDFYLKYFIQERYKRDYKEYYDDKKGEWVQNESTKYNTSSLFSKMKQTLKEPDHTRWTETAKAINNDNIRGEFEYLVSQLTFGHPFWSSFTNSESSMESPRFDLFSEVIPKNIIDSANKVIHTAEKHLKQELSHERNTVIYPVEPVITQIPNMLANGMTGEEVKRRILFNLITHEFGHVLGLRHNFYGSLDTSHWHYKGSGENKAPLLKTSSVMDYMALDDEAQGPLYSLWGAYDEAALVYSYSDGEKDLSKEKNTRYLFCTDHHRALNSLCNAWDEGSTPSEVVMSLIESYEELYFIRNLRIDRAFWDTSYYPIRMFFTMWNMKKPLMMWRTAFRDSYITRELEKLDIEYTPERVKDISYKVQYDIRQAIKLNMAFYNSVIQISSADRDWRTTYDEESGSVEKIGVFWDKLFAMYFLMGDDGFLYNPNHYLGKASYLTYIHKLGFRQMIEEIMENNLTVRIDMEPWFIDFGRLLYAKNASNFYNIEDDEVGGVLLEKIGIRCYTPKGLKDRFGIDPYAYKANEDSPPDFLDTAVIPMENYVDKTTDAYYGGTNEKLGVTFFDDNYYVASSNLNKYSFTIIDKMKRVSHSDSNNLRLEKQDVYDIFYLYNYYKKNGVVPQTCDNGD